MAAILAKTTTFTSLDFFILVLCHSKSHGRKKVSRETREDSNFTRHRMCRFNRSFNCWNSISSPNESLKYLMATRGESLCNAISRLLPTHPSCSFVGCCDGKRSRFAKDLLCISEEMLQSSHQHSKNDTLICWFDALFSHSDLAQQHELIQTLINVQELAVTLKILTSIANKHLAILQPFSHHIKCLLEYLLEMPFEQCAELFRLYTQLVRALSFFILTSNAARNFILKSFSDVRLIALMVGVGFNDHRRFGDHKEIMLRIK